MSHCAKIFFLQNFGDVKNEVFEKKIAFFVFVFLCWRNRNRKKEKQTKWKRPKKPIKMVFLRLSSKNVKNKNGFLAKISCVRKGKNAHFRAHYLFWPNIFLDQKQCKTIKIVVSAEIA